MTEQTQEVIPDGHVIFTLHDPYGDQAVVRRFEFREIQYIAVEEYGVRVVMIATEDGREQTFIYTWANILKLEHTSNSDAVAAGLKKQAEEKNIGRYAEESIDLIEKIANGLADATNQFGHPHVHQEDEDGPKVAHGFETPCGHGSAVKASNANVWTCIECASQWATGQWAVE